MRRGEYGVDAPYGLIAFTIAGIASAGVVISTWVTTGAVRPAPLVPMVFFWLNAASFWYTTRRGKFEVWDGILGQLPLRGDERVLDMGCGRGAVLTAVAKRLTSGRATGIDIWNTHDQSGNAREVTLKNAEIEGVGDRVDVQTGDMRELPFGDAAFDLVLSSMAIHNISSTVERDRAVAEAWRVLKPGGRLAIADIRQTSRYADTLRRLGAHPVSRRRLGWRFWWGNPIAATSLVMASKPPQAG